LFLNPGLAVAVGQVSLVFCARISPTFFFSQSMKMGVVDKEKKKIKNQTKHITTLYA